MLILVRHGRTAPNASGLLLGRADPPLDAVGAGQAARVADAIGAAARVVSSPLVRCRMTADAIAASAGVDLEVDERWIELDYGGLEGTPVAEVPVETWRQWRSDLDFVPAGGESLAALGRRVRAACDDVAASARTSDVVVVTHVSPLKAAACWALGVGDEVAWRLFVAQASMTRISLGPFGASIITFNETAHLGA